MSRLKVNTITNVSGGAPDIPGFEGGGGSGSGSGTVANTNIYGTAKASGRFESDGTLVEGQNIASVTRTGAGLYEVVFTAPMPNDDYAVIATNNTNNTRYVRVANITTTGFVLVSTNVSTGNASDGGCGFAVHDNEPTEVALTTSGDVINYSGAAAWGTVTANNSGGASSVALLGGMNVASVTAGTSNAKGNFVVTFATPMPDANYSVTASYNNANVNTYGDISVGSKTASSFEVQTFESSNLPDWQGFGFVVFATNALPPKGGTGTDAWGSWSVSTGDIRASFNIDSITNVSTGQYEVLFTTPMPNGTYSVTTGSQDRAVLVSVRDKSSTGFKINTSENTSTTRVDASFDFTVNATNATLPSTITQEDADLIINSIKSGGNNTITPQKVAILADVKPDTITGGSSVVGWQDRTLNTIVSDQYNLVTLTNDKEFTLKAGTYLIEWSAPGYYVKTYQTKLTNVTTGSTEQLGSSEFSSGSGSTSIFPAQSRSFGTARVNITSDTTYKIEQYCKEVRASNGLGVNARSGEEEIYTKVTITDLAIVSGSGTVANTNIYGTAKAWGKFDNSGTLLSSYNCTLVKDSTGEYTVTFITPMSSDQYVITTAPDDYGGSQQVSPGFQTETGFRLRVADDNNQTANSGGYFAVHDNKPAEVALTTFGDVINYSGAAAWGTVDKTQANGPCNVPGALNVASVTRTATGKYQVTFTTPMPSDTYAVAGSCNATSTTVFQTLNKTATGFEAQTLYRDVSSNTTAIDSDFQFTVNALNALPPKGGTGADAWAYTSGAGIPYATYNLTVEPGSTITRYDYSFVVPMPNTNYAVLATANSNNKANCRVYDKTTNGFSVQTSDVENDGAGLESGHSVAVFATNATLPSTITQEDADLIINSIKDGGSTITPQKVAILADVKPNGVNGGSGVAGWQDRTLNTIVSDQYNLATLTNDKEFTLKPGTYLIEWSAPGYFVRNHQTKLTNITTGSTEQIGSSEYSYDGTSNTYSTHSRSFGTARVNITADTTYKIEHFCDRLRVDNGLGVSGGVNGEDNIYTKVTITDLAIVSGSGTPASTNIYGTAKAWGYVNANGSLGDNSNVTSVTRTGTGIYTVIWDNPSSSIDYIVNLTPQAVSANTGVTVVSPTEFQIVCRSTTTPANGVDANTAFAIFDNTPAEIALTTFGDVINYSGTAAWANMERTDNNGPCDISGSFNVKSITRTSSGNYDVLFTSPMPSANYAVTLSSLNNLAYAELDTQTPLGFQISIRGSTTGSPEDRKCAFAVHALNALPPKGGTGTDAWGSWNSNTGLLDGSYNIASVTNISTGKYDVVFTTPMPDANYSINITAHSTNRKASSELASKTTTGFSVNTVENGSTTRANTNFDFTVNATNATLPQSFTTEQIDAAINNPGASAWGRVGGNGTLRGGLNCTIEKITLAYRITFNTPMPDNNYAVVFGSDNTDTQGRVVGQTATGMDVQMRDVTTASPLDRSFSFAVFATNALPPKGGTGTDAWGSVDLTTANGPCSVPASFNIASVTRTEAGRYEVLYTTAMPTSSYAVQATVIGSNAGVIRVGNESAEGFVVYAEGNISGNLTDRSFSFTVNATNATLPTTFTEAQIQGVIDAKPQGIAKAWGSIANDGSVRDSFGVSGSVELGEGQYRITLSTPATNDRYSVVATSDVNDSSRSATVDDVTTNNFRLRTWNQGGGSPSDGGCFFAVFSS